jgi:hypothetical protein
MFLFNVDLDINATLLTWYSRYDDVSNQTQIIFARIGKRFEYCGYKITILQISFHFNISNDTQSFSLYYGQKWCSNMHTQNWAHKIENLKYRSLALNIRSFVKEMSFLPEQSPFKAPLKLLYQYNPFCQITCIQCLHKLCQFRPGCRRIYGQG